MIEMDYKPTEFILDETTERVKPYTQNYKTVV